MSPKILTLSNIYTRHLIPHKFCLKSIPNTDICCSWLISFIADCERSSWYGYTLVCVIFLCSITRTFFIQHFWLSCNLPGMRARTALTAAIYKKVGILKSNILEWSYKSNCRVTRDIIYEAFGISVLKSLIKKRLKIIKG